TISYKRCSDRCKHVAASAFADNDVPGEGICLAEAGLHKQKPSLRSVFIPPKPSALLTMAAQITPNNEAQSPSSPKLTQQHARPSLDEPAEDRENGLEEAWSDDDGDEDGPKRKRPRPLSAS
ncbi:uncharacterized protein M437DRAFT_52238, partial [Aureobasidium melanogenum CBS 110374]